MKRFWRVGLVIVAVLALAGAAVGFVAAQTGGDGEPASEKRPSFVARLAENLGIGQEELEAAIRETQLELLDEAVDEGRISEEKAAKIRERIESGDAPLFPRRPHRPQHPAANILGRVADLLGVAGEEVLEALKEGQSLAQIAQANEVKVEDLSAFLLGELEARLAQAVEDGRITQERADEMLANASEQIDRLINHEGLPGDERPFGPHRFAPKGMFPGGFPEGGFTRPVPEDAGPVL